MASTFIAFLGYLILATSVEKSVGAGYFALFLVVGGNFSLFPLVMCVPPPACAVYSLTSYVQELGGELLLADTKARRRHRVHRVDRELHLYVSHPLIWVREGPC